MCRAAAVVLLAFLAISVSAFPPPPPEFPRSIYGIHMSSVGGARIIKMEQAGENAAWTNSLFAKIPSNLGVSFDGLAAGALQGAPTLFFSAMQKTGPAKLYALNVATKVNTFVGNLATQSTSVWAATSKFDKDVYFYVNSLGEIRVARNLNLHATLPQLVEQQISTLPKTLPTINKAKEIQYGMGDLVLDLSTNSTYLACTAFGMLTNRHLARVIFRHSLILPDTIDFQLVSLNKYNPKFPEGRQFGGNSNLGQLAFIRHGAHHHLYTMPPFTGQLYTMTVNSTKVQVGPMVANFGPTYEFTDLAAF